MKKKRPTFNVLASMGMNVQHSLTSNAPVRTRNYGRSLNVER